MQTRKILLLIHVQIVYWKKQNFSGKYNILPFEKQKKFCKPEQRDDNSYNLPTGQREFSYELTFWFISIENGGIQKSKNTLKVENNQFCDG